LQSHICYETPDERFHLIIAAALCYNLVALLSQRLNQTWNGLLLLTNANQIWNGILHISSIGHQATTVLADELRHGLPQLPSAPPELQELRALRRLRVFGASLADLSFSPRVSNASRIQQDRNA